MRGKHNKLGEGERRVRLGQDSLPNIAISVAETSGYYIRCFTRTLSEVGQAWQGQALYLNSKESHQWFFNTMTKITLS